ncbi:MAG: hypothetical protein JXB07_20420 [Anaerolineae bacterium]|nr:hypothetical protein [Anaerolineae bacterium]
MNDRAYRRLNLVILLVLILTAPLTGCDSVPTHIFDLTEDEPVHQEIMLGDPSAEQKPSRWLAQLLSEDATSEATVDQTATSIPAPITTTPIDAAPTVTPTQIDPTWAALPPATGTPTIMPSPTWALAVVISFKSETEGRVPPGNPVVLSWEVEGGSGLVTICGEDSNMHEVECQHDMPRKGTTAFTMVDGRGYMRFSLETDGLPIENRVIVQAACANTWFFSEPAPPSNCPNCPIRQESALAQQYQGGWMIRSSFGLEILFNDNTYRSFQRVPIAPGDLTGITPPEGQYLPDDAFSADWLGQLAGTGDLRDRLGWAITPMTHYQTFGMQCEYVPLAPSTEACYQLGPTGLVYQYNYGRFISTDPNVGGIGYSEGTWQIYRPD